MAEREQRGRGRGRDRREREETPEFADRLVAINRVSKTVKGGKRFGFALEEIRQLLDLYELDDQQYTQLSQTYKIGQSHLENMKRQREELDEAIADFEEQLSWGLQTLERLKGEEDAA